MDIPPDHWPGFCREFTRQHRGWLVSIEIAGGGSAQRKALIHDATLQGLSRDRAGVHSELLISLGAGGSHTSHRVPAPTGIMLDEADDGAHKGLRIDSENGETTFIEFRAPARLGTLDGIAEID